MPNDNHPLQNRVAPDGSIHAVRARGLMMGNRGGRLHSEAQTLGRARWKSKAWICCVTRFRDRHRPVMGPGYTELFFLDEATALAAGHRPCFECRRADAKRFASLWAEAFGLDQPPRAPQMDVVLHRERLATRYRSRWPDLPDGAKFRVEELFFVKRGTEALRWSFDGYENAPEPSTAMAVEVMTPPAIIAVLRAGYSPRLHPTAA